MNNMLRNAAKLYTKLHRLWTHLRKFPWLCILLPYHTKCTQMLKLVIVHNKERKSTVNGAQLHHIK